MKCLSDLLAPIKKRLELWQIELPQLVQPEPSVVRDRADLSRLIRAVELMDAALAEIADMGEYRAAYTRAQVLEMMKGEE